MFARWIQPIVSVFVGGLLLVGTCVTPAQAGTPALSFKIDFGPVTTAPAAGYVLDSGQSYNTTRGFGWETLTGAALDLTSETRDRATGSDPRLATIVHMDSGRTAEGRWQLVVPNGTYTVTVGVGDPEYIDSHHVLRAEGTVLTDFTPTDSVRTTTATGSVTVADGKLTLDQTGGTNTKIGFVDVVATSIAPSTPPPVAAPASLQITTPQSFLGLGNRMVFTTVNATTNPSQTFSIKNTASTSVNVTGFAFSGNDANSFVLSPGQASSFVVPAGKTVNVGVTFKPAKIEANLAILTINTNVGVATVGLGGMNAKNFEDVNEPSLQAIVDALGYNINVGVTDEFENFISKSKAAVGDEILSPYFKAADITKPVSMVPLAAYAGRDTKARGAFGVNVKGSNTSTKPLFSEPGGSDAFGGENQKLFPGFANGSYSKLTPGSTTTFSATGSYATFGIWDQTLKNFSDDNLNTLSNDRGTGQKLHTMRMYPAKRADGSAVANTFIVAIDSGTVDCCYKNFDYQDDVFLLSNVTPATQTTSSPSTTTTTIRPRFGGLF